MDLVAINTFSSEREIFSWLCQDSAQTSQIFEQSRA